jgi:hypothetical protein
MPPSLDLCIHAKPCDGQAQPTASQNATMTVSASRVTIARYASGTASRLIVEGVSAEGCTSRGSLPTLERRNLEAWTTTPRSESSSCRAERKSRPSRPGYPLDPIDASPGFAAPKLRRSLASASSTTPSSNAARSAVPQPRYSRPSPAPSTSTTPNAPTCSTSPARPMAFRCPGVPGDAPTGTPEIDRAQRHLSSALGSTQCPDPRDRDDALSPSRRG